MPSPPRARFVPQRKRCGRRLVEIDALELNPKAHPTAHYDAKRRSLRIDEEALDYKVLHRIKLIILQNLCMSVVWT